MAFVGSKELGVRVLDKLVALLQPHALVAAITIDDREDSRSAYDRLLSVATSHGVSATVIDDSPAFDATIEAVRPDLVVVAGWYRLIDVTRHAPTRFFGFHASPLPRYRGSAPLVWQILRGEPEIGLSFFELTPGMDEGSIVRQRRALLGSDDTIADALRWVEDAAAEMLSASLAALVDGTVQLTEQEETNASYTGARTPGDGLISWMSPARAVHDFVRAQTRPYPGAFTYLPDGTKLHVWRSALDPREIVGVPGSIIDRTAEYVAVACGEGGLRLIEVEVEGASAGPASALLRSIRLRLG